MRFLVFWLWVALLSTAHAEIGVEIMEWRVPFDDSRPRDPFAQSDRSVWFVGQRSGYLAHLNVETGDIHKIDLKEGSGPHNLIVDSKGDVWFAGNRTGLIGRYAPDDDKVTEFPMPVEEARDPHTLIFNQDESAIWFTLQGANMIGRLDVASGEVRLIDVPTERARPYGIKIAADGAVWVSLFGVNKLARIDPDTLEITEIELPREEARPRRLEITDRGVWYVDYMVGMLGNYDPATGEFTEWPMPGGENAKPYGMASDSAGRLWMVETGLSPNRFVGFDPDAEEFIGLTEIPSGGGAVRHMHYHEPSGAIWFGADSNYIGRALIGDAATEESN